MNIPDIHCYSGLYFYINLTLKIYGNYALNYVLRGFTFLLYCFMLFLYRSIIYPKVPV